MTNCFRRRRIPATAAVNIFGRHESLSSLRCRCKWRPLRSLNFASIAQRLFIFDRKIRPSRPAGHRHGKRLLNRSQMTSRNRKTQATDAESNYLEAQGHHSLRCMRSFTRKKTAPTHRQKILHSHLVRFAAGSGFSGFFRRHGGTRLRRLRRRSHRGILRSGTRGQKVRCCQEAQQSDKRKRHSEVTSSKDENHRFLYLLTTRPQIFDLAWKKKRGIRTALTISPRDDNTTIRTCFLKVAIMSEYYVSSIFVIVERREKPGKFLK